jgi:putative intracellular protease/amidase
MPKIAIIATSATHFTTATGEKKGPTGVWLEEIATPYYQFLSKQFSVEFFSIEGGEIPVDNGSRAEGFYTEDSKKFDEDSRAREMMKNTKSIASIDVEEFDGIFLPGGHGCCEDFYGNADLAKVIETFYEAKKAVGLDCHAPIALLSCKKADGKTPFLKGLNVTGFSDAEETAVGYHEAVPVMIEKEMIAQGAIYTKAEADWGAYAVTDGNLVTGQNPASSAVCVQKYIELMTLKMTMTN